MYTPPAFREDDPEALRAMIREARLCNLVTATAEGLMSTPLPLYLVPDEGEHGTLYGHMAKANPQWKAAPIGDALAIFMGPDAYITPSWYASKKEHGRVVPTWNYLAVAGRPAARGGDAAHGPLRAAAQRSVVSVGRAGAVRCGPAQGHRRRAPADPSDRGQAQDEPEPPAGGPARGRRRAGGE